MLLWLALLQHCGGPCEVPRGDDPVCRNPKFTIVAGPEKDDWRYLFNWIWAEDGKECHRLEETFRGLADFGYRYVFVSPAGNGFLVTGNAYTKCKLPPLFVFCDPQGRRLVERGLAEDERKPGPCPDCECANVLYVFDDKPRLSENGSFVELRVVGRLLTFYLPLGAPVVDREKFETRLADAEWAAVPAERRDAERAEIDARVRDLDSEDADARAKAQEALVSHGYRALPAIRAARKRSPEVAERARRIEALLKPADGVDLDLLLGLLSYDEEPVRVAARARLTQVLPPEAADPAAWLKEHRGGLTWDDVRRRFILEH